jgi:hypothetical protein
MLPDTVTSSPKAPTSKAPVKVMVRGEVVTVRPVMGLPALFRKAIQGVAPPRYQHAETPA